MGQIWGAANREEGYKLGRKEGGLVIFIDVIVWTFRCLFRFFSGRPMFGDRKRKTNATLTRPGTKLIHPNARPPAFWGKRYCWSGMPEWKRAAIRTAVLIVVLGSWWAYHFTQTHPFIVGSAVIVAVTPIGRRASQKWRNRTFHRVYLNPLATAAGPVLDIPAGMPSDKWISVSPNMPGLLPNLVKPMSAFEVRIRAWYGQWLEPIVRYVPERVMRAYWWVTGNYAPVTKAWRRTQ